MMVRSDKKDVLLSRVILHLTDMIIATWIKLAVYVTTWWIIIASWIRIKRFSWGEGNLTSRLCKREWAMGIRFLRKFYPARWNSWILPCIVKVKVTTTVWKINFFLRCGTNLWDRSRFKFYSRLYSSCELRLLRLKKIERFWNWKFFSISFFIIIIFLIILRVINAQLLIKCTNITLINFIRDLEF